MFVSGGSLILNRKSLVVHIAHRLAGRELLMFLMIKYSRLLRLGLKMRLRRCMASRQLIAGYAGKEWHLNVIYNWRCGDCNHLWGVLFRIVSKLGSLLSQSWLLFFWSAGQRGVSILRPPTRRVVCLVAELEV